MFNAIINYNMNLGRKYNPEKQRKNNFFSIIIFALVLVSFPLTTKAIVLNEKVQVFNVLKYGAFGDGKALDTKAIQKVHLSTAKK